MKNILSIIKKELTRFFTDKKLVATILMPGILIFLVYSLMGDAILKQNSVKEDAVYKISVLNDNSNFNDLVIALAGDEFNIETAKYDLNELDSEKTKLKNKEIDLVVLYSGDFSQLLNPEIDFSTLTNDLKVEVFQNSTKPESANIYQVYTTILDIYEDSINNIYDINNTENMIYDVASKDDVQVSVLTMILPMLVLMMLISGCMASVPESIAGEKERGTIATLLITPLKRSELAIGKIISLSVISICSALSSFIGIALSMPKLMGNMGSLVYGFKEYVLVLLVLIATILLFVTLLSMVSAQAKSVKEAGMYATPVMIVVMIVSISMMFVGSNVNIAQCFIPIFNSALILKSIFSLEINVLGIIITIATNIIYTGIGVFLLTKMFNSERLMFNK